MVRPVGVLTGCSLKASFDAAFGTTVMGLLVSVTEPSVALMVHGPPG